MVDESLVSWITSGCGTHGLGGNGLCLGRRGKSRTRALEESWVLNGGTLEAQREYIS